MFEFQGFLLFGMMLFYSQQRNFNFQFFSLFLWSCHAIQEIFWKNPEAINFSTINPFSSCIFLVEVSLGWKSPCNKIVFCDQAITLKIAFATTYNQMKCFSVFFFFLYFAWNVLNRWKFFTRVFSHRHSQFTGQPGKGESLSFYFLNIRASNEHSDI